MVQVRFFLFVTIVAVLTKCADAFLRNGGLGFPRMPREWNRLQLRMISYSSKEGVPAALVEERDACGVGFVASLNNKFSHSILDQALKACECMEHRGATSVDSISGDGAGVLTAIPWKLFKDIVDPSTAVNADGSFATAVAMIFLPQDKKDEEDIRDKIYTILKKNGFKFVGWRDVPVNNAILGRLSASFVPKIKQFVVQPLLENQAESRLVLEKRLYDTRREIQGYFRKIKSPDGYICSFSTQTIVYKGMLRSCDLKNYYQDLTNPDFETNFAIYHRRFSTNTVPKWYLAQPMRLLAHNGEINTLLGNINWVKSRQYAYKIANPNDNEEFVKGPLVDVGRSDSANLDSILESFVRAGYTPEEALMVLVPEAFEAKKSSSVDNSQVNAFYKYYESLQEAWDGPALLVFSDGELLGATLDRNGLRPARYMVTEDSETKEKLVHLMSEVGVSKILQQFSGATDSGASSSVKLIESGRLGPGEMITVNIPEGKLSLNEEVKSEVASRQDYQSILQATVSELKLQSFGKDQEEYLSAYLPASEKASILPSLPRTDSSPLTESMDLEKFITLQTMFGWGTEDVEMQIASMASEANEATFCMGDDCPLAALSPLPHTLYDYFKQRFAQVTNPPIDPLREGAVMSLSMFLGPKSDPLSREQSDVRLKIPSPILNFKELEEVTKTKGITTKTLSTLYSVKEAENAGGLKSQLEKLCEAAVDAVKSGVNVINLSDQDLHSVDQFSSSSDEKIFIPPLLAVGAVHHALIRNGLRTKASIIVTTGQAWSTHHVACLVGYGASAVVPYLAYDTVIYWHAQKRNQVAMSRGSLPAITVEKALYNYRKSVEKGLLKILSKMGISLLSSYHGAQIFEALGLSDEVVATAFRGTASRIGGMTLDEIAKETIDFYHRANPLAVSNAASAVAKGADSVDGNEPASQKKLFNYGFYNYMKSGEYHHNNQPLIKDILHAALRTKDVNLYDLYEKTIQARPPTALRDCLEFVTDERPSIPLEEVESVESIMKRFVTGGMSLGALSREAHETLAIGMNRIGARSNSGEGGEDPVRFQKINDIDAETGVSKQFPYLKGLRNGDVASSRIKQVASGRFGVTATYLMSAEQLEIKIAQGAKPGEGGQLPASKIDSYIASLRKSKPGITLISPPPHHDIYSIEDLAQLIHDLHQINPKSQVSVKLVSEEGIGTVASGVAKAGADIIHIAGHDGGTGASPASSIKHAGAPWELGLVESHTALRKNGLRNKVLLRADGGLKSGYDVVMAAAMGAEEFGFGTIALIAEGCIMARICHTNKCPVGVTSQNEELRKRFKGTPDNIVTFFSYIAEEVRHILAKLGYRSIEEIIGKPGLLRRRSTLSLAKTSNLDISYLIDSVASAASSPTLFNRGEDDRSWLKHDWVDHNGFTFDDRILADKEFQRALEDGKDFTVKSHIINTDRSALGRISGQIAQRYGDHGFPGELKFKLTGASGQSFGVWLCDGISLSLTGYANDYVGKGMCGGKIVVKPPEEDLQTMKQQNQHSKSLSYSIVGNTVLYGATGGELFVRGKGGERFAVRNSGATAVIESVGYHGCEYMTGGFVLVLGKIGFNFGAGMTGGLAFVFPDEELLDSAFLQSSSSPTKSNALKFPSSLDSIKDYVSPDVCVVQMNESYIQAREHLWSLLQRHHQETQSHRAKYLLDNFSQLFSSFVAIVPPSERKSHLLQIDADMASAILKEKEEHVARSGLDQSNSDIVVKKNPFSAPNNQTQTIFGTK